MSKFKKKYCSVTFFIAIAVFLHVKMKRKQNENDFHIDFKKEPAII